MVAPVRLIALAVLVGIVVGVYLEVATHHTTHPLFTASFPKRGLVTNEFAYENPSNPEAVFSPDWIVTSGSLFAQDGTGWTGIPDGTNPGPGSAIATDSAVFRLRTRTASFLNVKVFFRLKLEKFVTTARTPAQLFDGVHVWLRYQNADWLYFASVARRDGDVVIGKKLPLGTSLKNGGAVAAGGVYFHNVRRSGHPFPLNRWTPVTVTIQNQGHNVIVRMVVNHHQLAKLVDTTGKQTIMRPGAVGIRGDNTEFQFKDFQVTAL